MYDEKNKQCKEKTKGKRAITVGIVFGLPALILVSFFIMGFCITVTTALD